MPTSLRRFFVGCFAAALLLHAGYASATEITVSAAASLTNAFSEIKVLFEKENPDITVVCNFAASNPLLRQIEQGAPVDVFASADQETMNTAEQKGLIVSESRLDFARNALVLIVPADDKDIVTGVASLTSDKVARIAVGNPDSVPAGRYAKQSLTAAGIWDALAPVLIMGESVRQTLDYVARGEVQAGIVYKSDAHQAGSKVKIVATLEKHNPILYPITIIKASTSQEAAQKFIAFVESKSGQAILIAHGFSTK